MIDIAQTVETILSNDTPCLVFLDAFTLCVRIHLVGKRRRVMVFQRLYLVFTLCAGDRNLLGQTSSMQRSNGSFGAVRVVLFINVIRFSVASFLLGGDFDFTFLTDVNRVVFI